MNRLKTKYHILIVQCAWNQRLRSFCGPIRRRLFLKNHQIFWVCRAIALSAEGLQARLGRDSALRNLREELLQRIQRLSIYSHPGLPVSQCQVCQ